VTSTFSLQHRLPPLIEAEIKHIQKILFTHYTNTTIEYTLKRAREGVCVAGALFDPFYILGLGQGLNYVDKRSDVEVGTDYYCPETPKIIYSQKPLSLAFESTHLRIVSGKAIA